MDKDVNDILLFMITYDDLALFYPMLTDVNMLDADMIHHLSDKKEIRNLMLKINEYSSYLSDNYMR